MRNLIHRLTENEIEVIAYYLYITKETICGGCQRGKADRGAFNKEIYRLESLMYSTYSHFMSATPQKRDITRINHKALCDYIKAFIKENSALAPFVKEQLLKDADNYERKYKKAD